MARKKQNSSISLPNGRKRTISPGFFTDPDLLALSPLHRLFFEGLFCFADRSGRLLYKPIDLKIRILPMDAFEPVQGLVDLEARGLIRIYQSGPLKVIALKERQWREVQRMHPDEPESALPAPPDSGTALADPVLAIPVHGNASVDPIPVHGNAPEVVPPTPFQDRDLRACGIFVPAGSSGSSPPLPPSQAKGGPEARSCTCSRRPCRHDAKPDVATGRVLEIGRCALCGTGASAEFCGHKFCYGGCLKLAEAQASALQPDTPWSADLAAWVSSHQQARSAS